MDIPEDTHIQVTEFHTCGSTTWDFDNYDCIPFWLKANCKTDVLGELHES